MEQRRRGSTPAPREAAPRSAFREDVADRVHCAPHPATGVVAHFLRGARGVGDHAEALDPHPVQEVERLDHRSVREAAVGLQEHGLVLAVPQDGAEPVLEQAAGDRRLVDVVEAVARDREDDRVLDARPADSSSPSWGARPRSPWWSIGAVTMKMMSSTSITSTSGVTLMSARWSKGSRSAVGRPWSSCQCQSEPYSVTEALREIPLRQVDELEREVLHSRPLLAHLAHEVVVEDQRRDRGGEAGGGVDRAPRRCPGATAAIEVEPVWPIARNDCMIPQTVPKRPMNGQAEAVVARNVM